MANQEHLNRLRQGVKKWNQWREKNPGVKIDFSDADLRGVNLGSANLGSANLNHANLNRADLNRADLILADLIFANLILANLSNADLGGANLRGANLGGANLSNADFSGANLGGANLRASQALSTDFSTATLTGACIEDWNINSRTNLQGVVCEYIFTKYDYKQQQFVDRRPHDPNQIFAPSEFTKRYQIVLESVELFFNDGIDWKAFLASLEDLKVQYGDDLNIQGIEKKAGGSFVVRLEMPSDLDKGLVEREVKELYETNLKILEAKYHDQLQAKDHQIEIYKQKSADLLELAKLAASRPITVEAKAVAENHSSSETYSTTVHGNIGNLANKMQDQASQQANQYTSANLDEISALIQSLRGIAETFPTEKWEEANVHLDDLEVDLQHPEKRKPNRIKARLTALLSIAVCAGGAVATATDFTNNVLELSKKLEIPIEQIEPQPPQKNAIDVKVFGSD